MELKACAHCGGPARFYGSADGQSVLIACHECGIQTMERESESEAADDWNRREKNEVLCGMCASPMKCAVVTGHFAKKTLEWFCGKCDRERALRYG